jgi:two-component system sensor histidine kinase BarA
MLESFGCQVTTAINGEIAIKIAASNKFGLILMDINMPGIDGLATTKLLRQAGNLNSATPVIAISAYTTAQLMDDAKECGICSYLTKPITEAQLLQSIDIALAQNNSIDWQLGVRLAAGNATLAQELLLMLTNSLESEKRQINEYFSNKDYHNLRNLVHKLHGACCYCGVPNLRNILKNFEHSLNRLGAEADWQAQLQDDLVQFNNEVALILHCKTHAAC